MHNFAQCDKLVQDEFLVVALDGCEADRQLPELSLISILLTVVLHARELYPK